VVLVEGWWPSRRRSSDSWVVGVSGIRGWSAQPTSASSGQVSTAKPRARRSREPRQLARKYRVGNIAPVSLTDARGPYTLIVYGTTSPRCASLATGFPH